MENTDLSSPTIPRGIPSAFLDPITREIMRDPVTTIDGHCYERKFIEAWFTQGHRTSPITNLPLSSTIVVPNLALKQAIDDFFAEKRNAESQVNIAGKQDRFLVFKQPITTGINYICFLL